MGYSSPSELIAALEKDKKLNKQIQSQVASDGGTTYDAKSLNKCAAELMSLIITNLEKYYSSYNPIEYPRTYNLRGMFSAPIIDANNGTIQIPFSGNAFHPSALENDVHYSFVPILLNYGWSVKGSTKRNSRFEHFEGSMFITNAINSFNRKYAKDGITAKFIVAGEDAEMSSYSPYL
ncbi:hypothetical protein M2140_000153 [Clostridiales Family XIII bacterium PM5-7]